MSVLIETSVGDLVIDLLTDDCPKSCTNFLKLCKIKYYNFSPFYHVQKDFTCQTGDPNYPKGTGGSSIWGLTGDDIKGKAFTPEFDRKHKNSVKGVVSMSTIADENGNQFSTSQFVITLKDGLEDSLDDKLAAFGQVVEGFDTLAKINEAYCDESGRPLQDIRIKHTYVLEDPFEDPIGLIEPGESPDPTDEQLSTVRIGEGEEIGQGEDSQVVEQRQTEQQARSQALTLEIIGDLPFAQARPEENVLFVCKLNPITQDEDLELIFSRFGTIVSCEVIRDKTTGDSLQYAFIEYEKKEDCERAYFKMEGVLIDDSRIHVDFSQSVARMQQDRKRGDDRRNRDRNDRRDRYRDDRKDYRRYRDRDDGKHHRRRDDRSHHRRDRDHRRSNRDRSPR